MEQIQICFEVVQANTGFSVNCNECGWRVANQQSWGSIVKKANAHILKMQHSVTCYYNNRICFRTLKAKEL